MLKSFLRGGFRAAPYEHKHMNHCTADCAFCAAENCGFFSTFDCSGSCELPKLLEHVRTVKDPAFVSRAYNIVVAVAWVGRFIQNALSCGQVLCILQYSHTAKFSTCVRV